MMENGHQLLAQDKLDASLLWVRGRVVFSSAA